MTETNTPTPGVPSQQDAMTGIAKIDALTAQALPEVLDWPAIFSAIQAHAARIGAHLARTVVLLPYAQLMSQARQQWALHCPDGFAPSFETTRNWASRVGLWEPSVQDLRLDHGRDLLSAGPVLQAAGLGAQQALLAGPLVGWATQLAGVAASMPPERRAAWAVQAQTAWPADAQGPLAQEAQLARTALAWASHSAYAADVLFDAVQGPLVDALVVVHGLQDDPLAVQLAAVCAGKALQLHPEIPAVQGHIALHACLGAEDEAERAAACVLAHLAASRVPVALAATDRQLTRRISALLATRGVRAGEALRDETGWRLSTTHAAASVVVALRACAAQAGSDAVLDWLKLAPVFDAAAVVALEHRLRKDAVRSWRQAAWLTRSDVLTCQIEALRAPLQNTRPLADWLAALRTLLQACGLWRFLATDLAGCAVVDALGLSELQAAEWQAWPPAGQRMDVQGFTHWVGQALEAASYRPPHPGQAQVVVLPLAQMWGRSFAALVLPGADEQRLPAAPEPQGPWSAAQRQALGLPTRADLQRGQAAAWQLAMGVPQVDVLWRHLDDSGEALLPSPLVEALRLLPGAPLAQGQDARVPQAVAVQATPRPMPSGAGLPTQPLSASSYEQLRACPYRFFALRQLGLQAQGELDEDIDKADWGNWVHATLRTFHERLAQTPLADRAVLLHDAAEATTQSLGLAQEPGEFLPFAAAWPPLAAAYLAWLDSYEAGGGAFAEAEKAMDVQRGPLQLKGRIDRIDRTGGGTEFLIDYKTESLDKTKKRVQAGSEDTQLPFYALLSGSDAPRAAYLNLSEREAPSLHEVQDLEQQAADLHAGMAHDMERIAAGVPLQALGEGSVCDWCEVRGLCRKDFWGDAVGTPETA